MSVQHSAATILAGCVLVALVGCSDGATPEYKQMRLDNLNAAVEEFDAGSLGEVVCDVSGGEVSQGKGYTHTYVFSAPDSWQAILDQLNDFGYQGVESPPLMSFTRSDGISAIGTLVAPGEDKADLEEEIKAMGCRAPSDGYVYFSFEERGV